MSTPLGPGRRAALAIGVPIIAASVAWTGVGFAALAGRTTVTTTASYDVLGQHLSVSANDGDVAVRPSPDAQVHVTTTLRYGLHEPVVTRTLDATGLRVDGKCRWFEDHCSVNFEIAVPAGFAIDVSASGGDVRATGLNGDARLSSSGGDVSVSAMSGNLTLDSGGGDVRATRLTSPHVLATSSGGDVEVRFSSAPVAVDARSSGGDVGVHVPGGDSYRIQTSSSGGDVHMSVPRNDLAERSLTAQSSGGDVTMAPDGDAG
ncbi:MAG: hypothetical protein QOH99_727 [Frankiaceae bacterium]|nr:hypothetical protein [Frankiaceae bacterium]